jgi:hypothetical protein
MTGLPIPQGDLRNHLQIEALAEHHSTRGPMPCPRSQASGDAGLATIRLGSCGNVAVRIGGRCRRRSVIDRGGGTSSGIPTVVPTEPTETKSIELPITEAGVLPTPEAGALTTPEAGVLPSPENLQAAGRPPAPTKERSAVPRHDHIVVVILENKHRSSVIGSRQATYLNKLAAKGANMTHSCGVTHPSQPNYLALFSGSTHGMRSNDARSIFGRLTTWAISSVRQASASEIFGVFAEDRLPGMYIGSLRRQAQPVGQLRHAAGNHQPAFQRLPERLPQAATVSFVSPNMCHGMDDCSVRTGDRWIKKHFDRYARWAPRHNSWLIVTFDENAGGKVKPIFTIIVGAKVLPGVYGERLNHYRLLRTIEEAYGLPALGRAKGVRPLSTIWTS